jgi:type III restriction enzyme
LSSLRISYTSGGERHPLYPDFLFVRSTSTSLVVDLIDPHRPDLEDAPAKAVGLAEYADRYWHRFGRIELIIVVNDEIRRLDLTDDQNRDKVKMVQTNAHLRQLFEQA